MKNINELREELASVFKDLRAGAVKAKDAAELNNTAGKMINSLKVELEYYHQLKERPNIPFLASKRAA